MGEKYERLKLVNLTGHDLTLVQWDDLRYTIPSDGQLRVYSNVEPVTMIRHGVDIPLIEIVEQSLTLPDEVDGTLYVVSGIVAAKANRKDFVVPSRVVRDKLGKPIGCKALARIRA